MSKPETPISTTGSSSGQNDDVSQRRKDPRRFKGGFGCTTRRNKRDALLGRTLADRVSQLEGARDAYFEKIKENAGVITAGRDDGPKELVATVGEEWLSLDDPREFSDVSYKEHLDSPMWLFFFAVFGVLNALLLLLFIGLSSLGVALIVYGVAYCFVEYRLLEQLFGYRRFHTFGEVGAVVGWYVKVPVVCALIVYDVGQVGVLMTLWRLEAVICVAISAVGVDTLVADHARYPVGSSTKIVAFLYEYRPDRDVRPDMNSMQDMKHDPLYVRVLLRHFSVFSFMGINIPDVRDVHVDASPTYTGFVGPIEKRVLCILSLFGYAVNPHYSDKLMVVDLELAAQCLAPSVANIDDADFRKAAMQFMRRYHNINVQTSMFFIGEDVEFNTALFSSLVLKSSRNDLHALGF